MRNLGWDNAQDYCWETCRAGEEFSQQLHEYLRKELNISSLALTTNRLNSPKAAVWASKIDWAKWGENHWGKYKL